MSKRTVEYLTAELDRTRNDYQRHLRALQTELDNTRRLRAVELAALTVEMPEIRDVLTACNDLVQASSALTASPIEQTMSVRHADSTVDITRTGATHRSRISAARKKLAKVAEQIDNLVDAQQSRSSKDNASFAAHYRWHVGRGQQSPDCLWCVEPLAHAE